MSIEKIIDFVKEEIRKYGVKEGKELLYFQK